MENGNDFLEKPIDYVPSVKSKSALMVLARESGMQHLRDCVFSFKGETYIPSPIGWVKNLTYNYKLMHEELSREYENLKAMYSSERATNHRLKESLKDVDGKRIQKVIEILNSRITNEEKLKQLRRYLNL